MGGCRCTYKTCRSCTKTHQDLHYFHYPVKHRTRCLQWIKNAGRMEFSYLPDDQLRNKVICGLHFAMECFTNVLQKRLVHDAVPTLDVGCEREAPDARHANSGLQIQQTSENTFSLSTRTIQKVQTQSTYKFENGILVPLDDEEDEINTYTYNPCNEEHSDDEEEMEIEDFSQVQRIIDNEARLMNESTYKAEQNEEDDESEEYVVTYLDDEDTPATDNTKEECDEEFDKYRPDDRIIDIATDVGKSNNGSAMSKKSSAPMPALLPKPVVRERGYSLRGGQARKVITTTRGRPPPTIDESDSVTQTRVTAKVKGKLRVLRPQIQKIIQSANASSKSTHGGNIDSESVCDDAGADIVHKRVVAPVPAPQRNDASSVTATPPSPEPSAESPVPHAEEPEPPRTPTANVPQKKPKPTLVELELPEQPKQSAPPLAAPTITLTRDQLLLALRNELPASLHAAVSMHLLKKTKRFNAAETNFLVTLYTNTPRGYLTLNRKLGWKLPDEDVVKELMEVYDQ